MPDYLDAATLAWIDQHVWVWSQEDTGEWLDHPFPHERDAAAFEALCRRFAIPTRRVAP